MPHPLSRYPPPLPPLHYKRPPIHTPSYFHTPTPPTLTKKRTSPPPSPSSPTELPTPSSLERINKRRNGGKATPETGFFVRTRGTGSARKPGPARKALDTDTDTDTNANANASLVPRRTADVGQDEVSWAGHGFKAESEDEAGESRGGGKRGLVSASGSASGRSEVRVRIPGVHIRTLHITPITRTLRAGGTGSSYTPREEAVSTRTGVHAPDNTPVTGVRALEAFRKHIHVAPDYSLVGIRSEKGLKGRSMEGLLTKKVSSQDEYPPIQGLHHFALTTPPAQFFVQRICGLDITPLSVSEALAITYACISFAALHFCIGVLAYEPDIGLGLLVALIEGFDIGILGCIMVALWFEGRIQRVGERARSFGAWVVGT